MRRHAKASSAATTHGTGESRGLFGRSFATRGASSNARGSGAPSSRRAYLSAPLALIALMLVFAAAPALAANPPKVGLGITVPSDSALTFATLGATVNPEGQATTYFFEYGKTDAYGDEAPFGGTSAGSGTADVPVSRKVSELELNTTYHYRLVATNASGTTNGPDFTFETGPDLANGMHYELVSPADTNGSFTFPEVVSLDGNRVGMIPGKQAFADAESQHGKADSYLATRTADGWVTNAMNPPQESASGKTLDMTADLGTYLAINQTFTQYENGALQLRLMQPGNVDFMAFPEMLDLAKQSIETENIIFAYAGASDDLSHVVLSPTEAVRFLPSDPTRITATPTSFSLYEVMANPPTVRRVTLDNSGNDLAPVCFSAGPGGYEVNGGNLGRNSNAISADGSKIFFSVRPGTPVTSCAAIPSRQYVRINGTETVEISASECSPACASPLSDVAFGGASGDGSRATFSTTQQLVNADTDTTRDLYLYDFAKPTGQHLTLVSKGDATNPTPGSGAQVRNTVVMSDDGTRVYFVAGGALTTGKNSFGQAALAGANNLYLYEPDTGKTVFIARLDASDSGLWGVKSNGSQLSDAGGRYLLFSSKTQIAPGDTDAVSDLYRYDAQGTRVLRVTPGNTADGVGMATSGNPGAAGPPHRSISADGSTISFTTSASLQASDTNGVSDVYLWHEGAVTLVSDGKAIRGSHNPLTSTSGDEVAFSTAVSLVPKDANSAESTYVARTGADVEPPIVTPPPPCASSELCRGSTPAAPVDTTPGTPGFFGPGNEAKPNPHKKKHHKKKHHKKTHRAHKHSTHRAG